ncbi:unnamed protein product, partial [Rotaria sp. Silwood1]
DRLGKNVVWPQSRSSFTTINNVLKQMYQRWRIKQIEQRLPIKLQSTFELKLLAGKYLQQRPLFFDKSIYQEWHGDYLLEENSRVKEYQKSINELRTKDNFNKVIFSTFAVKLNSHIKMDERAIILTDKYIYKLDPKKNFPIKKSHISLDDVTGLSVTSGKEQLIVIHLVSNCDLVFYMQTKIDRVGEFVGHMAKLKQKSSNFSVNVQRYVSTNIAKHKYVINTVWDRVDKVAFNKSSSNNISLVLPDVR